MWNFAHFIVFLMYSCCLVNSEFPIDNEIIGDPSVDCEDSLVGLTFKTKKPFTGRVYVQGLSDDERCSRAFVDNRNLSRLSMTVQNGDCTMQRQRVTGKMEGLLFSLTMVISFHGTFVTRADRAFRCICFFRNQKSLKNSLQIGPMQPKELINTIRTPTCTYSIHRDSPDGPPVMLGEIGERIYHVWQCDDPMKSFLVHSCHVTDGRGFRFDLLDVDGCAIDPVIQADLIYDEDNHRAIAETYGYKFSDTNLLNYECVIEICSNGKDCDQLTPPTCERDGESTQFVETQRRARALSSFDRKERSNVDVSASISMINDMQEALLKEGDTEFFTGPSNDPTICLSGNSLILLLSLVILLVVSSICSIFFTTRCHTYTVNPKV